MKMILYLLLLSCTAAYAQQDTPLPPVKPVKTQYMNTDKLTHPVVKKAIDALQAADRNTWFAQFTADATLYDDGNKINLRSFFDKALGHERFTSIDKVENKGLDVYGHFHSDQWGDFKTYFKFKINGSGKIERLDIGQASY